MKAEELQLGDFIVYMSGQICNVIGLSAKDEISVLWYDKDGKDWYSSPLSATFFSPIELTTEILEKNGFWYQDNVGFVMEEYEYEVIYDQWNHKLRILKNREQIFNLEYFSEMCVHELQHALRLCGIDKTIEL